MDPKQSDNLICLSCGRLIDKKEDFGTNADGSFNEYYCRYCLKDGKFTGSDINYENGE